MQGRRRLDRLLGCTEEGDWTGCWDARHTDSEVLKRCVLFTPSKSGGVEEVAGWKEGTVVEGGGHRGEKGRMKGGKEAGKSERGGEGARGRGSEGGG
eukprot:313172-Rhodomonas_salina.3